MVKRTGITALVLAVLMLFTGCTGGKSGKIYKNATISHSFYLYSSSIIFDNGEKYRYTDEDSVYCRKLIKTYDELMEFQAELDNSKRNFKDTDEVYNNSRKRFYENVDEEYFEKYALLIVYFSGLFSKVYDNIPDDCKYSVKNININEEGVLSVNIKEKRPEFTFSTASYYMLRADILKADLGNVTEVSVTMTEN